MNIRRFILSMLRNGKTIDDCARYFHLRKEDIDLILWNGLGT